MSSGSRVAGLWIFALLVGAAMPSLAADSWGYDLGHELMSPYCPGRTLATCPSPQAAELVQWIVLQEASGASKDEVIESLIERFGEDILGAPKAEGIGLWAYILPVLGFVVGGGLVAWVLRRVVGGGAMDSAEGAASVAPAGPREPAMAAPATAEAVITSPDDALARQVDADLAFRD